MEVPDLLEQERVWELFVKIEEMHGVKLAPLIRKPRPATVIATLLAGDNLCNCTGSDKNGWAAAQSWISATSGYTMILWLPMDCMPSRQETTCR